MTSFQGNGRVLRSAVFRRVPFRDVHGLRTCILKHQEAPLAQTDHGTFCSHCGSPCLSLMYLGKGRSSWVPFYRTWNMIREFQDKMILNVDDLRAEIAP
jgi:hypothetical protein